MSIVLLVCAVAGYFGFSYLGKWQERSNASRDDSGGGGAAGEAGHISELNNVLDITEPDHLGMTTKEAKAEERRQKREKAKFEAEMKKMEANAPSEGAGVSPEQGNAVATAVAEMAKMPLASGVWAMDLDTAAIPAGRANGTISGTNFIVDTAVLVKVGPTQVLALRQGTNITSDCEMFIRFQLNAGEELAGHTWSISQEMKGKGVPQVTKSWKTNPRYAPTKKAFATGYAMKLEFGQPANGVIPGTISVSLPDPEQSYVVGAFKAALVTPGSN
ncbi:MAG: hypothetical protein JWM68_787 [Verrucomicrobiales bacterium]|nr:hypothetical protein [Verrucomicrobiales bacterium]